MPILLPNFNIRNYASCSSQERIVFNTWIDAKIIYGVTPQYIIKVKPRVVTSSTALGNFLPVVVIGLECAGFEQLVYSLSQAANKVSDLLTCHLTQINRTHFYR
jgi:hypothetical protein